MGAVWRGGGAGRLITRQVEDALLSFQPYRPPRYTNQQYLPPLVENNLYSLSLSLSLSLSHPCPDPFLPPHPPPPPPRPLTATVHELQTVTHVSVHAHKLARDLSAATSWDSDGFKNKNKNRRRSQIKLTSPFLPERLLTRAVFSLNNRTSQGFKAFYSLARCSQYPNITRVQSVFLTRTVFSISKHHKSSKRFSDSHRVLNIQTSQSSKRFSDSHGVLNIQTSQEFKAFF